LGFSSALETVRRPRGASRASSAPTSVSGQLCLCHCLDRLVGLAGDWVRASRCMAWVSPAPLRPCAARAALREQARSYICFGPVMSGGLPGPPWWFAWRLGQGRKVHALVSPAPLRPRAARAALREQARSYICFGPVMSVPLPGPPCWFGWGLGQGHQVHALVSPAPLRPCAARAALREQALLLHLFRASYACAIAWSALLVWLGIGSGPPGACLGFSSALETARRPRGASRASPLLHLFRASYVCAIAGTALIVPLEIGSGPPGACLGFSSALETARRPRGASRASSAPTSVSGQLCLGDCLVRLDCPP